MIKSFTNRINITSLILSILLCTNLGCNINSEYLKMDFDTFDQSDKGWRHTRFLDNYQEAADIII